MVDAAHRGAGVGRALMRRPRTGPGASGAAYVALATRRAAGFYAALGYEESASYYKRCKKSLRALAAEPVERRVSAGAGCVVDLADQLLDDVLQEQDAGHPAVAGRPSGRRVIRCGASTRSPSSSSASRNTEVSRRIRLAGTGWSNAVPGRQVHHVLEVHVADRLAVVVGQDVAGEAVLGQTPAGSGPGWTTAAGATISAIGTSTSCDLLGGELEGAGQRAGGVGEHALAGATAPRCRPPRRGCRCWWPRPWARP